VLLSPHENSKTVVVTTSTPTVDAGQLVFTNIERVVPCFTPVPSMRDAEGRA